MNTLYLQVHDSVEVDDAVVCPSKKPDYPPVSYAIPIDHFVMPSICLSWPPGLARSPADSSVESPYYKATASC